MEYGWTSPGSSSSMVSLTSMIRAPTTASGSVSAASTNPALVVIGGGQDPRSRTRR